MHKLVEAATTKPPIDLQATDTADFPIAFRLHLDTTLSKNFVVFLQIVFETLATQPFTIPLEELPLETLMPRSVR